MTTSRTQRSSCQGVAYGPPLKGKLEVIRGEEEKEYRMKEE
jgi:hypothetical protein